jgi:hypothetical protein
MKMVHLVNEQMKSSCVQQMIWLTAIAFCMESWTIARDRSFADLAWVSFLARMDVLTQRFSKCHSICKEDSWKKTNRYHCVKASTLLQISARAHKRLYQHCQLSCP